MAARGIEVNPMRRRRFTRTTDSDHEGPIYPSSPGTSSSTGPTNSGWRS